MKSDDAISKRPWVLAFALCLVVSLTGGCREEEPVVLLDPYESADVAARAYNFQVYPGSKFDQAQTDTFRGAHFAMNPGDEKAPPMAIYVTEDSIEEVALFYARKYGHDEVAESAAKEGEVAPAFYTSGDLAAGLESIEAILEQMGREIDLSEVMGGFRGAHISPSANMPRITLQRPFVDFSTGEVVERTMILMVRE